MRWDEVESIFEWDGSWRDLSVLNTSLDDWQRLLDFLRSSPYRFVFRRETEQPLPTDVADAFATTGATRPLLHVDLGGVTLACHFFSDEEIEFDLDPREVTSETRAQPVFDFMRQLGQTLGKPVRLTRENMSELALIVYDPASDELRKVGELR